MKVAVLGCGPAGLLAAHAIVLSGHEPVVLSRKERSVIPGSVYLHESVPEVTSAYPENFVQYIRLGTAEGYARKVYGDGARNTGWENYFQTYPSWNAVACYEKLWEMYENRISDVLIDQETLNVITGNYPIIISTLPAPGMCSDPERHSFNGVPYYIRTLPLPPMDAHRDVVVYNGLANDPWYRWSVLSGVCSIESTIDIWEERIVGTKATTTDCDCWPQIVRAGRWAEWRHGVLLNDAYKTALSVMKGAKIHG